jgi:hypothetical protein
MSISTPSTTDFSFSLPYQGKSTSSTNKTSAGVDSVAGSLALRLATFESQTFASLLSSLFASDDSETSSGLDAALGTQTGAQDGSSALLAQLNGSAGVNGLSATGRNSSLFDPESAFQMMSVISNNDVAYKAQFSELSQMKSYLSEMRQDAQSLAGIDTASSDASIKSQLVTFTSQYNAWIDRFDEDMAKGGVLADTQAAQVALHELDQSVDNIFNGASDGLHGLADLGLSIDPVTKMATFDSARLDSVLASNKQGVVDTVREFSANFAKSAELLNSDGNFIPNQLDNLSRVIDYYGDHKSALQAEFGLGDTAKPSAQVAQALAAYQKTYGI